MLSFLPLAHSFGRILEELALCVGAHIGYWQARAEACVGIGGSGACPGGAAGACCAGCAGSRRAHATAACALTHPPTHPYYCYCHHRATSSC